MLFLPHLAFSFHRGEPAAWNEQDKTEIQDLSVYFLIDCLPSQETAGIKRVTVKILELYFLHGHMIRLFIPQISEKGNISRTDRSSLLSPDPAGHRALQLHARGRNGLIPARWGLDRQLPSPEKGFSVEAELAEFKLALWLARRPSEIICTPSILPGWGHSGGRGRAAQGFIPLRSKKKPFPSRALCGFPLCAGTAVAPTSSISNVSRLHSSPAVQACLYQEQVPNRDMEFSRQASGTAAAKATVVGFGITIEPADLERQDQATLSA